MDSSLDEEQRELTQGIQQSAVFLLTVVNGMLVLKIHTTAQFD